ncbi:MAG TPA: condensation domain-containing protein, partial [Thermoanaerobaculia bacterium]|nr:condensation domain-containing protein [Thermoanaerobaculia bacterium]
MQLSSDGRNVVGQRQVSPIGRRADRGLALLSSGQRRLWFLDRWQPGSPAYSIASAFELTGRLHFAALAVALREIVRRHEILRTTFQEKGGEPVQVVTPVPAGEHAAVAVVDLAALPVLVRRAEADRLATAQARRAFDLARGPLWRAVLLRIGPQTHTLLLTLHHIVWDGWSTGILLRELEALYRSLSRGEAAILPELPIQYADFAVWQRRELSGGALNGQLAYWRRQLTGAPALLELPTDHPRPPVQGFQGGTTGLFEIGPEASTGLSSLARPEGVTQFILLFAAFAVLLHRYTASNDVVIGSPVAGRSRQETEGLIGFFVNMLALRVRPSGGQSFRELLGAVREVCLGAFDNQDLPFEALLEELQLERAPRHGPLFQVVLSLQNVSEARLGLPGLSITTADVDTGAAKFDLMLALTPTSRGLAGSMTYRRELFESATAERLTRHLRTLLGALTSAPDRAVGEVPIIGEDERRQILREWNPPAVERGAGDCLHRLFEETAGRAPDAVAAVAGDLALTRAELHRRAGRLARRLRRLGVGP